MNHENHPHHFFLLFFKLWVLQRQLRSMLLEKYIASNPVFHPSFGGPPGLLNRRTHIRTRRQSKREIKLIEREIKKKFIEKADSQRKNHAVFLKNVMSHREEFVRFHKNKRSDSSRAGMYTMSEIDL